MWTCCWPYVHSGVRDLWHSDETHVLMHMQGYRYHNKEVMLLLDSYILIPWNCNTTLLLLCFKKQLTSIWASIGMKSYNKFSWSIKLSGTLLISSLHHVLPLSSKQCLFCGCLIEMVTGVKSCSPSRNHDTVLASEELCWKFVWIMPHLQHVI